MNIGYVKLKAENKKLKKENQLFSNVLAIIHRDGGRYITKHGCEKASKDAIAIISKLRGQIEKFDYDICRIYKTLKRGN